MTDVYAIYLNIINQSNLNRIKLATLPVDPALLNSSSMNLNLNGGDLIKESNKSGYDSKNRHNIGTIVELLSEPIIVSHTHDIDQVADEVAELVSQHVKIRIDDSNSTVVSFKVVFVFYFLFVMFSSTNLFFFASGIIFFFFKTAGF